MLIGGFRIHCVGLTAEASDAKPAALKPPDRLRTSRCRFGVQFKGVGSRVFLWG